MSTTVDPATGEVGIDLAGQMLHDLRRPFTPAAIRFKIQAGGGTKQQPAKGLVIVYIDARLAIERLNRVVGLGWSDTYSAVNGGLLCRLTVLGVTREDVGIAGDSGQGGSPKAIVSDALKRAAVKFGVGVSLYSVPQMWVDPADIRYGGREGKPQGITDNGVRKLRQQYAAWIDAQGRHAFGDPLDHGDVDDSAGDVEAEHAPEPAAEPEPTKQETPAALLAASLSKAPADVKREIKELAITTGVIPADGATLGRVAHAIHARTGATGWLDAKRRLEQLVDEIDVDDAEVVS